MSKINIAVLMGGKSSERDISLTTGRMILASLDPKKYEAVAIDTKEWDTSVFDDMKPLGYIAHSNGNRPKIDVAFIALHGKFGEDGTIQGLLELLDIPYVGSGVLASALAIDKIMSRRALVNAGVPMAKGIETGKCDVCELAARIESELGLPVVVKPNKQGSSIGLTIPKTHEELVESLQLAFSFDDDLLIEQFIQGTEISVPILGDEELQVLPMIEIAPKSGFYDFESKYTKGATDEIIPPRISEKATQRAEELAIACHRALGCRDVSRTDMIICGDEAFVLEVNTIPGMTPTSLLPFSASSAGIEFPELLDRLIGFALRRG